jgi:hypothetical protein
VPPPRDSEPGARASSHGPWQRHAFR